MEFALNDSDEDNDIQRDMTPSEEGEKRPKCHCCIRTRYSNEILQNGRIIAIEGKRDAQYPMLHKTSYTRQRARLTSLRIYRIPYAGAYGLAGQLY
ncbi:hypothetical protein D9619_011566 [Psilocybe cf. subviscida]|uniref:Uncharacterized protein n=1 Tax=Psilocybe cf. subviscida TaxID=2480587 RepID=A0A8H5BSI5_9AGAR|nr:hypothetical protein D9619_011566 [Psilocybe cf. subviscida]